MLFLKRLIPKCLKIVLKRLLNKPLESLPDVPDLFHTYRRLYSHPDVIRKPGGWIYKESFYPDYLTVGGACFTIFREAIKYCVGMGIDVGAGHWPLPDSIPVDPFRGPGKNFKLDNIEDNTLDYIFSSHCLEHIENWKNELHNWISKLKINGVIFLYLPHPECKIWHPDSPFVEDGHKWIPTPQIIKETLRELSCEIIKFDNGPDGMQSFFVSGRKVSRQA